jgi:hypothetical protein
MNRHTITLPSIPGQCSQYAILRLQDNFNQNTIIIFNPQIMIIVYDRLVALLPSSLVQWSYMWDKGMPVISPSVRLIRLNLAQPPLVFLVASIVTSAICHFCLYYYNRFELDYTLTTDRFFLLEHSFFKFCRSDVSSNYTKITPWFFSSCLQPWTLWCYAIGPPLHECNGVKGLERAN